MKFLLLVAVLVIAYMFWRNARIADRTPPRGPSHPAAPQEMVSCAKCGVHLPRSEALTGGDGLPYCSQEHRLRSGG